MRALAFAFALVLVPGVGHADEPLRIDIAVPLHNGQRSIQFGRGKHILVVITNVGATPIRLWSEFNSWGYRSLSFEVIDDAGKIIAVAKPEIDWDGNVPDFFDVPAHEPVVFDEELAPRVWNLPRVPTGHLRMRAVYRVAPDTESNKLHVWTGEARSATYDFQLVR